ncbi:MAG: hypothetical protein HY043_16420 [Verrucomicrobia bacterium]|nr:hypothetical protein [Verrucomicrobiota bacterium]
MKTVIVRLTVIFRAMMLLAALTDRAYSDDAARTKSKTFTGIVQFVDDEERIVTVKGHWFTRAFNIGNNCKVWLEDKPAATLTELRPGNRVVVHYLAHSGVKIASQIVQANATFAGQISAIDPAQRSLTVTRGVTRKTFVLGDDCRIVIREDKNRTFDDLKLGHKVAIRYTAAEGSAVAHKIEQNSLSFAGIVEAIDATTGTLKVRRLRSDRRFILAKDCQLVIDGRLNGKLSDLRIGDKLSFHYENGGDVLVANLVERESSSGRAEIGPVNPATESAAYRTAK